MFEKYFEKYGHKCQLYLDMPFNKILSNKCFLRKWFMQHSVISRDYILLRCRPRSFASMRKESLDQLTKFPYAIHPFSAIALWWDVIWLCYVFIWFITAPLAEFNYLLPVDISDYRNKTIIVGLGQVICILDCTRRFFTGYVISHSDSDEIVVDPRRVSLHYLRTYFLIDFIPCLVAIYLLVVDINLPLKIFLYKFGYLRLIRLPTMVGVIKNIMRFHNHSHNFVDIFNSILILCIIVHWVSCYSLYGGFSGNILDPNATPWHDGIFKPNSTFMYMYIKCCYRSLSIMTGAGYLYYSNKIKPVADIVYTIFTAILGHILTIIIFAKIFDTLEGIRSSADKYVEMKIEISNYIKRQNLSKATRNKINTYYAYNYRHSYFDESELVAAVPISMQQNILLHSANKLLVNIEYFSNLPNSLVANILSLLEKEIVLAGDVIFRCNEVGNSIYFLVNGTVAEFTKSGREVFHFEDGSGFGECAVVGEDSKNRGTAVAIEVSEMYKLEGKNLFALLTYCPDVVERIKKVARQRIELCAVMEERYKHNYNQGMLQEYKINRVAQESYF